MTDQDARVTVDTKVDISQQFTHCKWDELLATISASTSHGASVGVWILQILWILQQRDGRCLCSEGLKVEAWKIGETPVETYQDDQRQPGRSGGKTKDTRLFCSGEEGGKG